MDNVNHPSHYTSHPAKCKKCGESIECIDITKHENFNIGSAMKYLWRRGKKGDEIEDLKKAIKYIEFEIERKQAIPSEIDEDGVVIAFVCIDNCWYPIYA